MDYSIVSSNAFELKHFPRPNCCFVACLLVIIIMHVLYVQLVVCKLHTGRCLLWEMRYRNFHPNIKSFRSIFPASASFQTTTIFTWPKTKGAFPSRTGNLLFPAPRLDYHLDKSASVHPLYIIHPIGTHSFEGYCFIDPCVFILKYCHLDRYAYVSKCGGIRNKYPVTRH